MEERDNKSGVKLADADSLLGMLQRGRGKGYLMVLETPPEEVWPLLFECVTNDPRADSQIEVRDEYYASLILKTGMDLEPLRSFVKQNDEDGTNGLALETLESLAGQGNGQALEILREYLQYGCDWAKITMALSDLSAPGAMDGVEEILYHRIGNDPQVYAEFQAQIKEDWTWYCQVGEKTREGVGLLLPVCEPWKSLCRKHDGLAELFARVGLPYDHPPASPPEIAPDVTGLSVAELLSSVDRDSYIASEQVILEKVSAEDEDRLLQSLSTHNRYRVRLAFRGLGKLGTPRAFEVVKSFIEVSENADPSVRKAAFDAIEQMPGSLTLETARQWIGREEWYLQVAADGILEHHATLEDVPMLIQALRRPETIEEKYSDVSSILKALARFENLGRIPELEQAFRQLGHSFNRGYAAKAMAATAPEHFTTEYAFECLWDCHWDTREIGCAKVNLSTPGAIERLQEIAADPSESEHIREIAKKRLETAV